MIKYMATHDFVIGQVDHMEASIPADMNVFDAFFDTHNYQYQSWKHVHNYYIEEKLVERPKKSLLAVAIPTQDYLRVDYLMDRLLEIKKPVLLIGPTAQGKSTLIRNYIYEKDQPGKWRSYDLIGFSLHTTGQKLLTLMEQKLVKKSRQVMEPPEERH